MQKVFLDRFTALMQYVRQRPALRRVLLLGWVLLWVVGAFGALEAFSRWWLVPWHQEIGNRHMQPYFMSGGYHQTTLSGGRDPQVMLGPGGPETYGYQRQGRMYLYDFQHVVTSIAERGTFLFQDRVHLANAPAQPHVLRLFVLGGSVAYGIGASRPENRWYAVLERSLQAALAQEVQVIPAAMVGYVSTQERLALEWMVLPRQPDAILFLNGWNDAALPGVFGMRPGDPYDQSVLYGDFYVPLSGLQRWLAQHSSLCRYLVHRAMEQTLVAQEQRLLGTPQLLANYAQSTAAVYLDNLQHMLARCHDKALPCAVFLQPARDMAWRQHGHTDLNPFVLAAYDQIRQGLQSPGWGTAVHDFSMLFHTAEQTQWFFDYVHFTDPGHTALAQAMLPIVLDMLRK